MATLNFIAEIDAEIQKLGLPVAKVANPANRGNNQEKISNFSRISNAYIEFSPSPDRSICLEEVFRSGWKPACSISSGITNPQVLSLMPSPK